MISMEKPHILHLLTSTAQASPFDVNMAYDAGYDVVVPYTGVTVPDVTTLTQDAIFSRGPKGVKRTGMFVGGRDLNSALQMFDAARKAMVPPFEISVLVDPSGAFTTAAAAVACVENVLRTDHSSALQGRRVLVLGATGPVGAAAGILAAQQGAHVQVASHRSLQRAQDVTQMARTRYQLELEPVLADTDGLEKLVAGAEVIIAAAKAGAEVLPSAMLAKAAKLMVAADVNAVPPPGIAGIGVQDNGVALPGVPGSKARGIGALAIGNIKYQVERGLFESMLSAEKALYLDFVSAFDKAREVIQSSGK
jgi:methylene-tetrahydromethanopterin dehydrogenase